MLTNNVYMDDICESVDTLKEAQRLTKEVDEVLKTGGFSVKGWISNKMLTEGVKPVTQKGISVCEGEVEKVLGTTWNCKTDKFHFEVRASLLKVIETPRHAQLKMTNIMILSQVAQIYDRIGLAAAFIVKVKIGVHQLWQLRVDWDKDLLPAIQRKWISLFQEMKELENVPSRGVYLPPMVWRNQHYVFLLTHHKRHSEHVRTCARKEAMVCITLSSSQQSQEWPP